MDILQKDRSEQYSKASLKIEYKFKCTSNAFDIFENIGERVSDNKAVALKFTDWAHKNETDREYEYVAFIFTIFNFLAVFIVFFVLKWIDEQVQKDSQAF